VRGFVDAEGYFTIGKQRSQYYFFTFGIGLHIDDLKVLEFIQKSLQMGKIYKSSSSATFMVRSLDDIYRIIDIFTKAPLNSNKQLNFLAFKKAVELYSQYSNTKDKPILYTEQMEAIRASMNKNRTDFV
jgi:hypothetical protein